MRLSRPALAVCALLPLALALAPAPALGARKSKTGIEFVALSFPAVRETKAVELAVYGGPDEALRGRFAEARGSFEKGLLELNLGKAPTPATIAYFDGEAARWRAIADDPGVPAEIRAAALHNAANCATVNHDFARALELATLASAADPKLQRYAIERDALRDGFYAKKQGIESVTVDAPRLEPAGHPDAMPGVASAVEIEPPQVKITPLRTVRDAVGFIWVNDRKTYRVAYQERVELSDGALAGTLTLHNGTERVVDCRGIVVQVSINGNPAGGPADLRWKSDPSRLVPGGKVVASFAVARPSALPAEGTLTVAIYDVPASISATGAVEGKRNATYAWSITRARYPFEAVNRIVEEKITPADAETAGRAVAGKPRFEVLGAPAQ